MGKIYINENQSLVLDMIKIYQPVDYDWMSYLITVKNILTFHHIIEQSQHGLTTIENGALITKKGHRVLNILSKEDYPLYRAWNDLFKDINQSMLPPNEEHKNEMQMLKKYSQKKFMVIKIKKDK